MMKWFFFLDDFSSSFHNNIEKILLIVAHLLFHYSLLLFFFCCYVRIEKWTQVEIWVNRGMREREKNREIWAHFSWIIFDHSLLIWKGLKFETFHHKKKWIEKVSNLKDKLDDVFPPRSPSLRFMHEEKLFVLMPWHRFKSEYKFSLIEWAIFPQVSTHSL